MSESDGNTSIESRRSSKRIKKNPDPHLALLIIHGYTASEIQTLVSDHPMFHDLKGFYTANARIGRFYTDEMHQALLEELGDDIRQLGDDPLSDFSKQSALYELFAGMMYGGRAPKNSDVFSTTIIMYIEPARFRFLK